MVNFLIGGKQVINLFQLSRELFVINEEREGGYIPFKTVVRKQEYPGASVLQSPRSIALLVRMLLANPLL